MMLLSQAPNGALSARRLPSGAALPSSASANNTLFSKSRPRLPSRNPRKPPSLALAAVDGAGEPPPSTRPLAAPIPTREDDTAVVGDAGVPLEGVIRAENSSSSSLLISRAQVALLAGGDVLCLLTFSAIGRLSHGFPVLDFETIRTADPFVAGWVLSAYFLGGYGDDGRGVNGYMKAIIASARSWAVGIPMGIAIRASTLGRIPSAAFVLVSMASTGILLIGWRALVSNILVSRQSKKNDLYKRGSPFELFELLMSLVRRW